MSKRVICPYCQSEAVFLITPEGRKRWSCPRPGCGSYVGAHEKSGTPLGTLANRELRLARQHLHTIFDPIWRVYHVPRADAYKFLSKALGIPKKSAHIGRMDLPMCLRAAIEADKAIEMFKVSKRVGREYVLGEEKINADSHYEANVTYV